jgi:hypothetical protein
MSYSDRITQRQLTSALCQQRTRCHSSARRLRQIELFPNSLHSSGNNRGNCGMAGSMGVVAASLARGDGASDRGKWWISGNQLCQRWTSWMDGKSYC